MPQYTRPAFAAEIPVSLAFLGKRLDPPAAFGTELRLALVSDCKKLREETMVTWNGFLSSHCCRNQFHNVV